MSWSQIAKLLLSAGSKAPQVVAILMAAFQLAEQSILKLEELGPLLGVTLTNPISPVTPPAGPVALSVEEQEAKAKVLEIFQHNVGHHIGDGPHALAFGDGKFAEKFGKFLQNPLVQQLIGLALQKLLAGS